jgi:hypothetical protein
MTYIKPILHALTLAATIGASGALCAGEQSTDKPPLTEHPATEETGPKGQPTLESLDEAHPAAKLEESKGPPGRTGDKPCTEHKPSGAAKDPAKKDCGPTQK